MKYKFECDCGFETTVEATPKEFEDLKQEGVSCEDCDGDAEFVFEPSEVDVNFRGGGWRDKSFRERRYRQKRSKKMAKRQKKKHDVPELQPNFEGTPTESWEEARAMASKADGYFEETYDDRVESESD